MQQYTFKKAKSILRNTIGPKSNIAENFIRL